MKRFTILKEIEKKALKFNELKNIFSIKSNELSYHIKQLKDSNLIEKIEDKYYLSKKAKEIYPYLPILFENQIPVFVVTSVALISGKYIYLQKKPREPDKGKLTFYGSKAIPKIPIEESAKKHVLEQAKTTIKNIKLQCVNEYLENEKHWIVYFFTATPIKRPLGEKYQLKDISKLDLYADNKFLLSQINLTF